MTLNHFHTPKGDNKELNARILKNQELLIKIFSCPTDGLPEKHNGWGPLEKYLIEKCGKMPFMNREEIISGEK